MMFRAMKYWPMLYILLSCSLKKTYLSAGKVSVTGERKDMRDVIVMKNINPVIENHDWRTV